jgi:hypothetical protein
MRERDRKTDTDSLLDKRFFISGFPETQEYERIVSWEQNDGIHRRFVSER